MSKLQDLQNYKYWEFKTPHTILTEVKMVGGWGHVFPDGLKDWAHRLRNYFNETPRTLKRLTDGTADMFVKKAEKFEHALACSRALAERKRREQSIAPWTVQRNPFPPKNCPPNPPTVPDPDFGDEMAHLHALSGDVYKDEQGYIWYQMDPGGAIYHWGLPTEGSGPEAIWNSAKGQKKCPIFKLVSPDGTGGSREVIIWNRAKQSRLGELEKELDVSRMIERLPRWYGSYNYAETTAVGMAKHTLLDVKPDKQSGPENYIEPPMDTTAKSRIFPFLPV